MWRPLIVYVCWGRGGGASHFSRAQVENKPRIRAERIKWFIKFAMELRRQNDFAGARAAPRAGLRAP